MSTRRWMARSATSTAASSRTGRARRRSTRCGPREWCSTGGSAAGRSPAPTRAAGIGSRSRPTSERATRSTRRWSSSPTRTPTRTSATTKRCRQQSPPGPSSPKQGSETGRSMGSRRPWALLSLLLLATAAGLAVGLTVVRFPRGLTVLACLAAAALFGWYAVRRHGMPQMVGVAGGAMALAAAVVFIVVEGRPLLDAVIAACLLGSLAAARRAFRVHVHTPPAPARREPVLFYNPKSGDGKAERFDLANEALRRGMEAIELRLGDDLEQLVRDAIGRGADGLAMAGGDGSQAIVAMVAAEHDIPYACIPAGTRNHFALDLGVDREDVVGALDAFVSGGERHVDLAEVNGQVFVNNVSLGLYAESVQREGYREAKLRTILRTVPDVVGPQAEPHD